jgi:hypothetical protein
MDLASDLDGLSRVGAVTQREGRQEEKSSKRDEPNELVIPMNQSERESNGLRLESGNLTVKKMTVKKSTVKKMTVKRSAAGDPLPPSRIAHSLRLIGQREAILKLLKHRSRGVG